MTLQIPATFDRDNIPAMAFLKVLPAEQRGVFHSLMDALKAARAVVFRVGGRRLDDAQVAQMACEHVDVLQRVLPELEFTRFILRDEDGAIYSPHLVERHIRREERAAARAEKQRRLEEFQERQDAGEFAPEASVKVMSSRANAARGGRPRKGETSEQARERREREAVEQREMRLLSSISGGAVSETENEKRALEISEALISKTVARVLKIGRLPDGQAGFAKSICGRFLRDGIPADVLVEAVKQHTEKMALNGDTAYKMGAFRKPIERFWADHQAGVSTAPVPESTPREDWEDRALEAYAKAQKIWSEAFHLQRDYSAVKREWPELAKKHDLPACPVERAAYLDWYRPQAQAA